MATSQGVQGAANGSTAVHRVGAQGICYFVDFLLFSPVSPLLQEERKTAKQVDGLSHKKEK
eukprot:gene10717-7448_t